MWSKQFKPKKKILSVAGSIMIVGALTWYALLHSVCVLKGALISVQSSLIRELILYEFEMGHHAKETTKNFCYAEDEYAVDLSKISWWFKKFHSGLKNIDNQS